MQLQNKSKLTRRQQNNSLQMGAILGKPKRADSQTTQETFKQQKEAFQQMEKPVRGRQLLAPLPNKPVSGYTMDERLLSRQQNSTLGSQVANLKQIVLNQVRRNKIIADVTYQAQSKMDVSLKYFEQQQSHLQNKFNNRIDQLSNQLHKQRQSKAQMNAKLAASQQSQTVVMGFMRKIQQQGLLDISQIKQSISSKANEQNIGLSRQKQKAKALFLQVVRLGQQVQKGQQKIAQLSTSYQTRIINLQSKFQNSQKNIMTLAQRDSSGTSFISQTIPKFQKRIQQLQHNLLSLGKQHLRATQGLSSVTSTCARLSQDVSSVINNLSASIQQKLHLQAGQIVDKLVAQHQQRLRAQDDIRNNLDLKQRMQKQRQAHGRQQIMQRYNSMDSLVKAQFLRKDQAIRGLQQIMQDQIRLQRNQLRKQQQARISLQQLISQQLERIQQGFRKQYDSFRTQQYNVAQKINQIIRREIETRLATDIDLKNLTRTVAGQIVDNLNQVKQGFQIFQKQTRQELLRSNQDAANRASKLSHYIDNQIERVKQTIGGKYQKLKLVFTKIAQQFRTHLISTQGNRKDFDKRLVLAQKNLSNLRGDTDQVVDQIYQDMQSRLKQEKDSLQQLFVKKTADLTIKIGKLQASLADNSSFFKQAIDQIRSQVTVKLSSIAQGGTVSSSIKQANKLDKIAEQAQKLRRETAKLHQQLIRKVQQMQMKNAAKAGQDITASATDVIQMKNIQNDQEARINGRISDLQRTIQRVNQQLQQLQNHSQQNTKNTNLNLQGLQSKLRGRQVQIQEILQLITQIHNQLQNSLNQVRSQHLVSSLLVKTQLQNIQQNLGRVSQILQQTHSTKGRAKINQDQIKQNLHKSVKEQFESRFNQVLDKMRKQNQQKWQSTIKMSNDILQDLKKQKDKLAK